MWRMSEWSGVDVENERAEWRMSEQSGCGQYLKRIRFYLRLQKIKS